MQGRVVGLQWPPLWPTNCLQPNLAARAGPYCVALSRARLVFLSCSVQDQNPEGKYEALTKYGRDLTQAAREGKLDPVIGRCD